MSVLRSPRPEVTPQALNERSGGHFPALVGMEVVDISAAGVKSRLASRPELLAPNGYIHAGALVALADTTCGFGAIAFLPDGARSYATLDLQTNFVGAAREGAIVCAAVPVDLGRQTQSWDAVCLSESDGRQLALFRCTQLVLY